MLPEVPVSALTGHVKHREGKAGGRKGIIHILTKCPAVNAVS